MQQQMYSGTEHAPNAVPYVTNDIQGPHGYQGALAGQRQMVPPQVPSGYPAYALPGARYPMRGPGPSQNMQGQQYTGQQYGMQVGAPQPQIPIQVCGAHNVVPSAAGQYPRQANPQSFSSAYRNNQPGYVQPHQACQMPESSQRFMTGGCYPNSAPLTHRYPNYGNPNQSMPGNYNNQLQSAQIPHSTNYHQQRPGYHQTESYGYYSQSNQYQGSMPGSQQPNNQMVRHPHGHPNPMNTMNNPQFSQMHPNPSISQNQMYGAVRGSVNPNVHPNQYQMYPQYNNPQSGTMIQPGHQTSQMIANTSGMIGIRQPNSSISVTTKEQLRYYNNQGQNNPTNQIPQQGYSNNLHSNQSNVGNGQPCFRQPYTLQNASPQYMPTEHSNHSQRAPYPHTMRLANTSNFPQHQNTVTQMPGMAPKNAAQDMGMVPTMSMPNISQNVNAEISQHAPPNPGLQKPMFGAVPKEIESLRDSIESVSSVTYAESPLADSGPESITHQEDEDTKDTVNEAVNNPEQMVQSHENQENSNSCDNENQEEAFTNVNNHQQVNSSLEINKDKSQLKLVDDESKDGTVTINMNPNIHQNNPVQAILCPPQPSSSMLSFNQTSSSSSTEKFGSSETENKDYVVVPWGWKRVISADIVVYVR